MPNVAPAKHRAARRSFDKPRTRPWPVTMLSLLLLLQAVGLFAVGTTNLLRTSLRLGITPDTVMEALPHAARGSLFIALALLALLVSFSFFRLRRTAWLSALLVQGLTLLFALSLYLRDRPGSRPHYAYVMMLYALFMVVYLNYGDVPAAFRPKHELLDPRDA
jgi:hypothetical protein